MPDPSIERWKKYLRYDPTRWLLETDDPSIVLWYQLDIAHRPEDAPGVVATRERVLYSDVVQKIFRRQSEWGSWEYSGSLVHFEHSGTVWQLVLLAELGIPRSSRRARIACEFALQNFLLEDGWFAGLDGVEAGYLIRALAYFNLAKDERVIHAAHALAGKLDSYDAQISALWAWSPLREGRAISEMAISTLEQVLSKTVEYSVAPHRKKYWKVSRAYTFPQFNPRDELFLLRVLAEYDRLSDPRVAPLIDAFIAKQDKYGRWRLPHGGYEYGDPRLEYHGKPSRWLTLNALRVIVKLVELSASG